MFYTLLTAGFILPMLNVFYHSTSGIYFLSNKYNLPLLLKNDSTKIFPLQGMFVPAVVRQVVHQNLRGDGDALFELLCRNVGRHHLPQDAKE